MEPFDPSDVLLAELELQAFAAEEAVLRQEYATEVKASFLNFVRHMRPSFRFAWFHLAIIEILDCLARGKLFQGKPLKNVMLSMPPRHGKTTIGSELFVAYYLGLFPDKNVMGVSYGSTVAAETCTRLQNVMAETAYLEIFPETIIPSLTTKHGNRSSHRFSLVGHKGGYRCDGYNGKLTGRGADLVDCDDLIKTDEEAMSEAYKKKLKGAWTSNIRTRVQGDSLKLLIMTRWAEDDLPGELILEAASSPDADQWTIINFPAVKEDDEDMFDKREVGETLWPEQGFDAAWAATAKASSGAAWDSLYQQRPNAAGGNEIKTYNFRFWHHDGVVPEEHRMMGPDGKVITIPQRPLPRGFKRHVQSWDMAFKDTKTSDFVAGGFFSTDAPECPKHLFLRDIFHARADVTKSMNGVTDMKTRYPETGPILIEDKANGPAVMQLLEGQIEGLTPILPDGGKIARARVASVYVNSHNVYLPHPTICPDVLKLLSEARAFPKAKHDDLVDMLTQAINHVYGEPGWCF